MDHFYQKNPGWFTFPKLYSSFINICPVNGIIAEIGCWKGKSSAYLVVEAINSAKNIKICCVDNWLGDSGSGYDTTGKLYETFLENMKPVIGKFEPFPMSSVEASKLFNNNSIDIVFIDADHAYEHVKEDILAWLPKVKQKGIIAGHDLEAPSVVKAVSEVLPNYQNAGEDCWIYYRR